MGRTHIVMNNIVFLLKTSFSYDKNLFAAAVVRIPVNILIPLLASYLTKYMTSIASEQTEGGKIVIYVLFYSGLTLVLTLINNYATAKIKYDTMFVRLRYLGAISDKNMDADFQNVEDPSGQ